MGASQTNCGENLPSRLFHANKKAAATESPSLCSGQHCCPRDACRHASGGVKSRAVRPWMRSVCTELLEIHWKFPSAQTCVKRHPEVKTQVCLHLTWLFPVRAVGEETQMAASSSRALPTPRPCHCSAPMHLLAPAFCCLRTSSCGGACSAALWLEVLLSPTSNSSQSTSWGYRPPSSLSPWWDHSEASVLC